ncbi:hypothetical protein PGTUg99_022227 [Puccinia graminis f. sp. tritici]|uniref:Uncharacterized protein n=1 Tax=Puccinia graminis f. sp. tritici TaxID=56615 RepID=A0A5B0R9I4_PUCGR|nr:hypothetical protein PGTUg99_022227 [Puccinia graminis f. sp. tritici]
MSSDLHLDTRLVTTDIQCPVTSTCQAGFTHQCPVMHPGTANHCDYCHHETPVTYYDCCRSPHPTVTCNGQHQ